MTTVNETHDHAVNEKMNVLAYTILSLLQRGLIFFLSISHSLY